MMNLQKQGVALIWTLVVSTTLIIVGTSLANTIMKDSKNSFRVEYSSQAYASARSGIEKGKIFLNQKKSGNYDAYKNGTIVLPGGSNPLVYRIGTEADAPYVKVSFTRDSSDGNYIIKSTGYDGDVARALEYKMISQAPKLVKAAEIGGATSVRGSWSEDFTFWFSTKSEPVQFNFGLADSATSGSNNSVFATYLDSDANCTGSAGSVSLRVIRAAVGSTPAVNYTDRICLNGIDLSDYHNDPPLAGFTDERPSAKRFVVSISYINNLKALMTLKSYDYNEYTTIGSVARNLDSSFAGFSNKLTYTYHYITPTEGSANRDTYTKEFYGNSLTTSVLVTGISLTN